MLGATLHRAAATAGRTAGEKAAAGRVAGEKAVAGRAAGEKAATGRIAGEKAAALRNNARDMAGSGADFSHFSRRGLT